MNKFVRQACGTVLFTSAVVLCAAPAEATPFAGVQTAYWRSQFSYFNDFTDNSLSPILPDGIIVSCFGGASSSFGNGCRDFESLIVTNGSASISNTGGFTVTNTNDTDLLGRLVFTIFFSAFNPGGPSIGAQVDDPTTQYAAFSSSVFGPPFSTLDFHSCNTLTGPNFMGPNACGVFSPDSSQVDLGVGPLEAGESISETFRIDISAQVIGIAEPTTLAIFALGLAGVGTLRRRKKLC